MAELEGDKRRNLEGQLGFFDSPATKGPQAGPQMPTAEEFSHMEKLGMEKEVTGMYLSGHPMLGYSKFYSSGRYAKVGDIFKTPEDSTEITTPQEGGIYKEGQKLNWSAILWPRRREREM